MLAKGLFRVGIGLGVVVHVLALGVSMIMFTLVEPRGAESGPGVALLGSVALIWVGRPDRAAYRFGVRGVTVALGKPFAGHVMHDPAPSRWRTAVITAAGSLANLVVAGVLLALGLATGPALSGAARVPVHQAIEVSLAALFAATGISGLLPLRTPRGIMSDGARLLTLVSGRRARALRQDEMLAGPKGAMWNCWTSGSPPTASGLSSGS